jgi:DNA-binding transcriptional LysR family regulator
MANDKVDLADLNAFVTVARAKGFRDGARAHRRQCVCHQRGGPPSGSAARRAASQPDHSQRCPDRGWCTPTCPALTEVEAALDVVNAFRDRPAGTLRLNVPAVAARLVLPSIVPPFLAAYPEIRLEVIADDSLVDVIAAGCDAGIRYEERLEQDMIAVPIGPRLERFATAAAPAYLDRRGRPQHPRELLSHACLRGRFSNGALAPWEFERDGEVVQIDPAGPLVVNVGAGTDLIVDAAVAGTGIIYLFEDWLRPHLQSGALEPVIKPWWLRFSGPFLYYPGRRLVPSPLRAFIDFIKALPADRA